MAPAYLLFDGHCRLCTAGSRRVLGLARPGAVELLDFQEPGVLARFPGVSHPECMREMKLVTPGGRVFGGVEAVVRVLATRGILGSWAYLYYIPGLRQIADAAYVRLARNRYRLMERPECASDGCALHVKSS